MNGVEGGLKTFQLFMKITAISVAGLQAYTVGLSMSLGS
jgi:hypothetical protein